MTSTGLRRADAAAVKWPLVDLAEIAVLPTQFEIFRFMRRVGEQFGFDHFIVARLPEPATRSLAENSIIANLPAGFLAAYDRLGLFSPAMRKVKESTVPFAFACSDLAGERCGEETGDAERLYAEFGLKSGLCVPVHDPKGLRSAVFFAGSRGLPDHEELADLTLVAIHVFQRLTEVAGARADEGRVLTERELDCLSWTAAGKTSADIAQILSLSEHTVNHYLNRAARKLDTVNRTQAVAKALRRGLIV